MPAALSPETSLLLRAGDARRARQHLAGVELGLRDDARHCRRATVTDLTVAGMTAVTATLTFTAPGADGNVGTAAPL